MDYLLLTGRHRAEINHRKLLELEAEHLRLDLDLRLADATDIDNENVAIARQQLHILERQIETLKEWILPQPVEPEMSGENGQRPISAS